MGKGKEKKKKLAVGLVIGIRIHAQAAMAGGPRLPRGEELSSKIRLLPVQGELRWYHGGSREAGIERGEQTEGESVCLSWWLLSGSRARGRSQEAALCNGG